MHAADEFVARRRRHPHVAVLEAARRRRRLLAWVARNEACVHQSVSEVSAVDGSSNYLQILIINRPI